MQLFTAHRIRRANELVTTRGFVFFVDSREFVISLVETLFLSGRVCSEPNNDITTRKYEFGDLKMKRESPESLAKIIQSKNVPIVPSSRKPLISPCRYLESTDLEGFCCDFRFGRKLKKLFGNDYSTLSTFTRNMDVNSLRIAELAGPFHCDTETITTMRILTELHERTCRSGRGPEEQQDGSDD
jgi:hypothetical protein